MFNGPVIPLRPANRERPYEIKAQDKTGEVYLYDVIGDGWDGTTASQFKDDLKAIGNVTTLNIFINSPGGAVVDGVGIFNVLKRHKARKVVQIDGLAASIASVIAMAGDEIHIAGNALMMIHRPWGLTIGDEDDHRKAIELLVRYKESILSAYVDRSSSSEEQLREWMDNETWFDAKEAVDAGLADVITEQVEMAALARHDLLAMKANFRHVPESLIQAAEQAESEYQEGHAHPAVSLMETRLLKRNHGRETA